MAKAAFDPKAKARRQKKIAIVGSIFLVALLAFQVPRTMKMLNPKSPVPATSPMPGPTTTTDATAAPAAAAAEPVAATVPAATADALVVNSDLSPTAQQGQLTAFTASFSSKDPFRQQLQSSTTTAAEAAPPEAKPKQKPAGGVIATGTAPTGFTQLRLSATISVNGVASAVGVETDFPSDSPLFHLVALTARTAQISIAGGSLSSGAPTVMLRLGKPLTLMNTADGTRYRLILVSTSTQAVAPPAVTTQATTTTTPTG